MSTVEKSTPRPTWRRLTLWALVSVGFGIAFAAASGQVIGDFVTAQAQSKDSVYLVNVPAEEDMLRRLSAELMQGGTDDATRLSDIAPAAGEPLGSFTP